MNLDSGRLQLCRWAVLRWNISYGQLSSSPIPQEPWAWLAHSIPDHIHIITAVYRSCQLYRYLLVLERKTRGRQLHLAKRFGPKRAFFSCKKGYKTNHDHHQIIIHFAKWSCLPCVLHSRTNKYLYIDVVISITTLCLHTLRIITTVYILFSGAANLLVPEPSVFFCSLH